MGRVYYIAAVVTVTFLLGGCGYNRSEAISTESTEMAVSKRAVPKDTEAGPGGGEEVREEPGQGEPGREKPGQGEPGREKPGQEEPGKEEPGQEEPGQGELGQEELRQEALRQAEAMDFTVQESPVDRERYDIQADRVYKEAFLKAVTNQVPVYDQDSGEAYFYRDLLGETGKLPEDQFMRAVRESDYFYQDFDGDGLPELTVDTEGPCVLKYYLERDRVELSVRGEEGWHLLGDGQMYARFTESDKEAYTYLYCYEAGGKRFCLKDILHWYGGWQQEPYLVSFGEYIDMAVEEETAVELLGRYFAAVKQAPRPMTFSVLFGDGEGQGYMPGEEAPVRYGLRDTDILPVNEESGQEWEAYKAMMEGDFSVVEDEGWVRLQSDYEDELERNDGRCGWSYFLMDFNQDGVKELVLRIYPDGVNNMASFCYEDGHIRLWGHYGSADSHGYQVPLANGKILSVSWYQNNREWWVSRVDSRCRKIYEQYYYTWENQEVFFEFWDCYHNGEFCGSSVSLTEEEWGQIEDEINGLMIPEDVWKPCSVFTPKSDRPEIPGVG